MRAFGIGEEAVRELKGTVFEVEQGNWETVMLFLRVATQWRTGAAGYVGLDYGAVDVVMRRFAITDADGSLFAGLQVMEHTILTALAER